jgi:hypothetical protein
MWADSLTLAEVEATIGAATSLGGVSWAVPLLQRAKPILDRLRVGIIDRDSYRRNPLQPAEMSFLFEIRFARAIASTGLVADYEYAAGVGETTVDFRVGLNPPWFVELVSLHESEAFKRASWTSGAWYGYSLGTNAEDPRQSEEGETLKAQERIGNKVLGKGQKPIKFPEPSGVRHMLMVDARGFMGDGHGDGADWHQIGYGPLGLDSHLVKFWTNPTTGLYEPIRGVFEEHCPLAAARLIRERIHVLGFICEKKFDLDEISRQAFYCCNPALFGTEEEARHAMAAWPLRRE